MTGEALPSLWRVIGLLNHPKLHKWRKHSRLKGSQLVVITWYFQDVGPPPSLFSPHILFRNLSTSGVLTRTRHLRAVALRSRSDHQCQNCQPVVLAGGGEGGIGGGCEGNWDGRELVSCVFFFFYSTQPPETVREEESDGLVEEKEAAMMCWQLSCLAVKEGNFSRLRRWAVSFFVSHYIFLFCVFFEGFFFFFFHYLNSSLSQLCQMIIKMESKVTTLLFQPFFFYYWIHSSLQASRIIQNNRRGEKNHSLTTCWHVQPVTGFHCVIFKGHKTKKAPAPLLYNS